MRRSLRRLRGAPEGLPFVWDERTIRSGLNFTLSTSLGAIDLLGEVAGGGEYEDLEKDTETIHVFGVDCLCVSLDALIRLKRAAGRRKDLEAIAELEAIREEREKPATPLTYHDRPVTLICGRPRPCRSA